MKLTPTQLRILDHLHRVGGACTFGELRAAMPPRPCGRNRSATPAWPGTSVRPLARAGYVLLGAPRRRVAWADRPIALTANGRRAREEASR